MVPFAVVYHVVGMLFKYTNKVKKEFVKYYN